MVAHTCIGEENRSSEPVAAGYINAYRTLADWLMQIGFLICNHESVLLSTDHCLTKKRKKVSSYTQILKFALKTELI